MVPHSLQYIIWPSPNELWSTLCPTFSFVKPKHKNKKGGDEKEAKTYFASRRDEMDSQMK